MLGYLVWHGEGRPRVKWERRSIGGATFCVMEVWGRERRVARRVHRALTELTERGVRRWIIPPGWPDVWRDDLREVEEDGLRQALFPQILDWLSAQGRLSLGRATVELSAPWADGAVWEAARILSRRCRYLRLRVEGDAALRQDLWRRYGIAVVGEESPASLQVCFGQSAAGVPALLLGPGCGRRQRAEYDLPEAVSMAMGPYPLTPQMVAALWQCGAVKTEDVRLKSLDFPA